MIEYGKMDMVIGDHSYFYIDEMKMDISLCIDGEDLTGVKALEIDHYSIGENLFNFLAIGKDDLKRILRAIQDNPIWNERHSENDDTGRFLLSLDCVYLYILFYSFNRGRLGLEYRSRLDRIQKEFEFAMNFCCNDDFDKRFKPLSSLQRYYLYSQIYIDNILTTERRYQQNNFLFLDIPSNQSLAQKLPQMPMEINKYGQIINEFEPITEKPQLTDEIISSMANSTISLSFRYEHERLEEYLMEELFSLIKLNMRVKKCKNCGKYFILKGDYATNYCNRIPDGQKFTCKKLAAMRTRKKKVQNSPILKEYEKAYKRMYARLTNHKLSNEDFRLWVENASSKRDSVAAEYSLCPSDDIINQFKEYLGNK